MDDHIISNHLRESIGSHHIRIISLSRQMRETVSWRAADRKDESDFYLQIRNFSEFILGDMKVSIGER